MSRDGRWGRRNTLLPGPEDGAGDVALEGAHCFTLGLALLAPAGDIGLGRRITAELDQGDAMDQRVEGAVAGPVEAVALLGATGGGERGGAGVHRHLGVGR